MGSMVVVHYYVPLQGKVGLRRQIDKAISNAKYMAEQIKKRDGYELVSEPEYTNCSFWYYPLSMRGPPDPHKLTKVGWGSCPSSMAGHVVLL